MGNSQSSASRSSVTETVVDVSAGRLRWPDDVRLYYLPQDRELLPDKARRLMFQAYLGYANLSYTDCTALNADYMSPTGHSPFLFINFEFKPVIFADFFKFVEFIETQNLGVGKELDKPENAECAAFVSLVKIKLLNSLEYKTWICSDNLKESLSMYGYGLPWPVRHIAPYLYYARYVWSHWDTYCTKDEEVMEQVGEVFRALSVRLGDEESFYKSGPTVLDAVVYGCLEAILTNGPSVLLDTLTARGSENLLKYCENSVSAQRKGLQFITYPSTQNLSNLH